MSKARPRKPYCIASDPSQGRLRRQIVTWLGLVLLAFNILAGNTLPARADGDASPTPFDQIFQEGHTVICTASGLLVLDRDGRPADGGNPAQHGNLCVFCLPLMQGAASVPFQSAAPLPVVHMAVLAPWHAAPTPLFPARPNGAISSRGPPAA